MAYRMLTDLPAACRSSGLKVVLVPGWNRRGRPASTGSFSPRGVVAHHTGDSIGNNSSRERAYAGGTLASGFASLPGPLCHIGLGRDGTVYIVAVGRANHAGRVRNSGFMRAGDGNSQSIGIEAMNSGFEGWTDVQLDAYHSLCAALCDHYGWPRRNVRSHAEVSTSGKWDPGINYKPIIMTTFRRGVAAVTGGIMALSKREANAIAKAILNYEMHGGGKVPRESFGERLRRIRISSMETNESITRERGDTNKILDRIVKKLGA